MPKSAMRAPRRNCPLRDITCQSHRSSPGSRRGSRAPTGVLAKFASGAEDSGRMPYSEGAVAHLCGRPAINGYGNMFRVG